MEKKALLRIGERRHARYDLAIGLHPVQPLQIDPDGNLRSGLPKISRFTAKDLTPMPINHVFDG